MKYRFLCFVVLLFYCNLLLSQEITTPEIFRINNIADTILFTALGTQITIKANSVEFIDSSSEYVDVYDMYVNEIVDKEGMLLNGVSTNSAKGILISDGMIRIVCSIDGKKLKLTTERSIEIRIPSSESSTDMNLYVMNDNGNWNQLPNQIVIDTCESYIERTLFRDSVVTKKEYREWDKSNNDYPKGIFGGGIRSNDQQYYIPVPYDKVWWCNENELLYYNFEIYELGWYNIDKLTGIRNLKNLKVYGVDDLKVFLVIHKEEIVIESTKLENNTYLLSNIPSKRKSTIIGYRLIDSETIMFSTYTMHQFEKSVKLTDMKTVTVPEFKRIIRGLKFLD